MRKYGISFFVLLVSLAVVACESKSQPSASKSGSAENEVDGAKYLLASEPPSSQEIIAARDSIKQGDPIVLVGRIGGSVNPWIEGLAAFTIVDRSLKACNEIPEDKCPKPWDYCCETDETLARATILVKFVDDQSNVVAVDARKLLNVAELNTVVVRGKVQRSDDGKLAVLADGLYVRR
jgi:hypothetical protein